MAKPTTAEIVTKMQEEVVVLRTKFVYSQQIIEGYDIPELRERLAVLEAKVDDLKRFKDETEKRHWQFIYIFAGGLATLLTTLLVQLAIAWLRK